MIATEKWEDYVRLLRRGCIATQAERAEWWGENVVTRHDALFAFGALLAYNARLTELLVPPGIRLGPVPVPPGSTRAVAHVRRMLNARFTNDRDNLTALLNVVLDAARGDHGEAGLEFAADVVAALDKMACNGHHALGWTLP